MDALSKYRNLEVATDASVTQPHIERLNGMSTENRIFLMRPTVGQEELEAVGKVFDSKFLTEGSVTQEFEKRIAEYVGAKYAVAVTSCTTALELALQVMEIGSKTEVIVPSFTHLATADAAANVGATPVLVDVHSDTYNMDFTSAKSGLSPKTRATIPVSLFGRPIDTEGLADFVKSRDIAVIEDAACSLGAAVNGKKVGTFADITCFSFHPRKLLTTGEGGMLVTDNEEYAEKARSMKNFGLSKYKGALKGIRRGSNYKMSNIMAAIGLVQLSKFENVLTERRNRARVYDELLARNPDVQIPISPPELTCTYQSYCVLLKHSGIRDKVRQRMIEQGIEVQLGTNALHLEPVFSKLRRTSVTNSTKVFKNALTLPLHNELTREDQDRVCSVLDTTIRGLL